ncbi:unnamed protein product, partial [Mesorhabditis belari]|uniref:Trifunctional purine biosynthetic protein adenosine-3 n=1 Tax=Mesorhabditis belari TaxID=2138241 RepID=A0AAF3EV75_9BILA
MSGVLIIGSGGREHALAWKLLQSESVNKVRIVPGNGSPFGFVDLDIDDPEAILAFCALEGIEMVVIGPEIPLAKGLVDRLQGRIAVFGPTQDAAMLEISKSFAKKFMREIDLPTALYGEFEDLEEASKFIESCNWDGIVVKADGLAAGKGVIVCSSKEEAKEAAKNMLQGEFGSSGSKIILEERLDGYEVSALCFADGATISRMPLVRDYKRLLENDAGPNTGGMGAIGPVSVPKVIDEQISEYLINTIKGLQKQRMFYKGVLYAGFMITSKGPYILEYNCRFGDPETEILMRLLDTDLYQILHACVHGSLDILMINWKREFACGVVLSSKDYPAKGDKGTKIRNIPLETKETVTFHAGTALKDNHIITNGGRILCVTSLGKTLEEARKKALSVCDQIEFEGKYFRRDIGITKPIGNPHYSLTYGDSGVDIREGNQFVEEIKGFVQETLKSGTSQIGGFGAIIDLQKSEYDKANQIVTGIDGVGTKIEIADAMDDYRGIGHDVVGMCVNDILCHCAAPVAFLDYFVCGKLNRRRATEVVKSISEACIQADCSLVGGETAEMPGVYGPNQWDLAGCAIGVRQPDWPQLPETSKIQVGDIVLGISSSGLHSNGFSLVRKILQAHKIDYKATVPWGNSSFGQVLLTPTKIYVRSLLLLMRGGLIKGAAHITGGGITENAIRVLDREAELALDIDASSWPKDELFNWLGSMGPVTTKEMLKTFNCGIGMTLVVSKESAQSVKDALKKCDEKVYEIGKVVRRTTDDLITYQNLENAFDLAKYYVERRRVRVGILISGAGTNMQKLIERAQKPGSNSEVVVVISNIADAGGLEIAQKLEVTTAFVPHTKIREEGDMKMSEILHLHGVELICLAGYMRILSGQFVKEWENKMINIHPALLPAFRGGHAVRETIAAGVKVTGCTAHLVVEEVDAGQIIAQEVVRVEAGDTEETLHERIKEKEHTLFPDAMELMSVQLLENK